MVGFAIALPTLPKIILGLESVRPRIGLRNIRKNGGFRSRSTHPTGFTWGKKISPA